MRIVLDTNRYSDMARGDAAACRTIETSEQAFLPFVVLAELRAGFLGGNRAKKNEAALNVFLRRPPVSVLWPDAATTFQYAALFQQLAEQGRMIPTNDIWIAALTVQHGLTLYARDQHFAHLPQLMRI